MTYDLNSIATLYAEEQSRLKRLLVRRGIAAHSAADAVHEAFIRLLRAPSRDIRDLRAYLHRTVENVAIDMLRRERRGERVIDPMAEIDANAPDGRPLQDAELISREEVALLDAAIFELSPRCREVLVLHKFEGLSYAEIAARLGISKNTVMAHMVKALASLKGRLGENPRRDGSLVSVSRSS